MSTTEQGPGTGGARAANGTANGTADGTPGGDVLDGRPASAAAWHAAGARGIADPGPLGLAGFGLTTFVLSLINAGLIPADTEPVVLGLALAYGGVAQFAAGMWEFRKGNTFGATAFTSYGAFWVSFWAYVAFYAHGIPAGDAGTATGWFLISWGIFTTIMWFASLRTSAALVVLFLLLAITFYLLGAGELAGSAGLAKTGGWFGIVTAAVAWYTCLAGVTASTFGRQVLPNPSLARG